VIQVAPISGDYVITPGPPGHTPRVYHSVGVPTGLHTDGDLTITDTGDVYQQVAGAWAATGSNIRGPAGTGGGGTAAPPLMRSVRIVSDNNSGLPAAPTWRVIVTSGTGTLPSEPLQCKIPAAAGNRIRAHCSGMYVGSHFLDLVLLAADGSISQYAVNLGSDHPTVPGKEGHPGFYPALSLSKNPPMPVFTVGAEHISGGLATIAFAHQGTGTGNSNIVYAFAETAPDGIAYAFSMLLENLDQTEPAP
jgi:hypothetical protein